MEKTLSPAIVCGDGGKHRRVGLLYKQGTYGRIFIGPIVFPDCMSFEVCPSVAPHGQSSFGGLLISI